MNLMEGLIEECNRNRELKKVYNEIPTGAMGAALIQSDIDRAEKAMGTGDVVEMLEIYNTMKSNE